MQTDLAADIQAASLDQIDAVTASLLVQVRDLLPPERDALWWALCDRIATNVRHTDVRPIVSELIAMLDRGWCWGSEADTVERARRTTERLAQALGMHPVVWDDRGRDLDAGPVA